LKACWSEIDGYLPYQHYEQCEHSLCNAHLLRNLTFVAENEPAHKDWTEALAKLLLRIKEAVGEAKLKSQSALTSHQQNLYFGHYDRVLWQAEQVIRSSPKLKDVHLSAHNLYRRFLMNKHSILRFMTDFRVPFDNNGSERDLRMLKLQQKISGCFRSTAGASVFCRVRYYLLSARKQGHVLLSALESALRGQPIRLII
jgi:transposase